MNTDHSWMPAALSCMAQRFNDHRTVEDFNVLHTFYDQQHQNRHGYQWRGGYDRLPTR
jgi:hypothetical protein